MPHKKVISVFSLTDLSAVDLNRYVQRVLCDVQQQNLSGEDVFSSLRSLTGFLLNDGLFSDGMRHYQAPHILLVVNQIFEQHPQDAQRFFRENITLAKPFLEVLTDHLTHSFLSSGVNAALVNLLTIPEIRKELFETLYNESPMWSHLLKSGNNALFSVAIDYLAQVLKELPPESFLLKDVSLTPYVMNPVLELVLCWKDIDAKFSEFRPKLSPNTVDGFYRLNDALYRTFGSTNTLEKWAGKDDRKKSGFKGLLVKMAKKASVHFDFDSNFRVISLRHSEYKALLNSGGSPLDTCGMLDLQTHI